MNNNFYYNYRPNLSFIRNVPVPRFNPNFGNSRFFSPLPRIGSIFSGGIKSLGPNAGFVNSSTGAISKLSFSSILSGTSKTLGVINQAIPVFYQVKPIVKNAKTMFRVFKEMNTSDRPIKSVDVDNEKININNSNSEVDDNFLTKEKVSLKKEDNSPTFFI